jgi:hypothetical protein
MATTRINPKWKEELLEEINEIKERDASTKTISRTSSFKPAIQWMVTTLLNKNIPYKVINCGAGVTIVTGDVNLCPKCHGTGKC